jgi:hypothetical protein
MRRIYLKDIALRKDFIDLGGLDLLYTLIQSSDSDIITEVVYNIDDLIYV